ncbi:MAG TPA: hypothetical protein VK957_02595 [Lunatimonas sp.]|nr:hypothetical protein [Lunatimonas sp.]
MENFGVIITCCETDYCFAKGTCASVKYFMPNTPICFLVDGEFDLGEFPKDYDIIVLKKENLKSDFLKANSWGWGLTKMNAFWESPFETFLLLDADTALYGDMTKYADFSKFDFIIDDPKVEYTVDNLRRFFFNPDHIEKYFPGFSYLSNPYVCTGVLFGKRDILRIEDYKRYFEIISIQPDLFFPGEQGFLNVLLFQMAQKGDIRLGSHDIQYVVPDFTYEESKNNFPVPIIKDVSPQVIHWAGSVKPLLQNRKNGYVEPLIFFREKYLKDLGVTDQAEIERILSEEDNFLVANVNSRTLKGRIKNNIKKLKNLFS